MKRKPTYNDFRDSRPNDLKKFYKLSDRQLERSFRDTALHGATKSEMTKEYEKFYVRNRHDS